MSGFSALDWGVVVLYMGGIAAFGLATGGKQASAKDYFLSEKKIGWGAVTASIVATETSTVTFISVPGVAFTGNWTFLQLVMGYMVGRIVVSIIFVPAGVVPERRRGAVCGEGAVGARRQVASRGKVGTGARVIVKNGNLAGAARLDGRRSIEVRELEHSIRCRVADEESVPLRDLPRDDAAERHARACRENHP